MAHLSSIDRSIVVLLIVPIDKLVADLLSPSRYREDAISIIAVVGASENRPRQTASASYVTVSLSRYK
jgi:hypothetical protein